MTILSFTPEPMLLMSLALLSPPHVSHQPQELRVSVADALARSGQASFGAISKARKAERQIAGVKQRTFARRLGDSNRRNARLRRSGKLLWADADAMRAAHLSPRDAHGQLAAIGVSVDRETVRQILNGELWQEDR